MIDLFQTSIDQTGVAICEMDDGSIKQYPLFSTSPVAEFNEIVNNFPKVKKGLHLFVTNNFMAAKIEDIVRSYMEDDPSHALPENYVSYMVSGFPMVRDKDQVSFYYA